MELYKRINLKALEKENFEEQWNKGCDKVKIYTCKLSADDNVKMVTTKFKDKIFTVIMPVFKFTN